MSTCHECNQNNSSHIHDYESKPLNRGYKTAYQNNHKVSTVVRQVRETIVVNEPNYKTAINSYNNNKVFLDKFLRSFAINDEYVVETGMIRKHGIPSAMLDWEVFDTPEYDLENTCNFTWQYKNGELLIRDKKIEGNPNTDFGIGGQVIIRRSFKVPVSSLEGGYPANTLSGLGDAMAQFFDGITIVKDPSNNNKFKAKLVIDEQTSKFYLDETKSSEVFKLSTDGSFYYLNPQSLDNQIKVKADGVTIGGDGKTLPLQVVGALSNGSSNQLPNLNSLTQLSPTNLAISDGTLKLATGDFDLNAKSYSGEFKMAIALPKSTSGKWKIYFKNNYKIVFNDNNNGWDNTRPNLKALKYQIDITADNSQLFEPNSIIPAKSTKYRTIIGTDITEMEMEKDSLSGVYDISDQVKSITIKFTVITPRTATNPLVEISENLTSLTLLSIA